MKSYVQYLQGLYSAMLFDVAEHYPSLRRDCERDSSRLLSLIESRGLSFLMIDLPEMGKFFDRSLSNRLLTNSGIAGQRPYRRGSVIPRLFKGLLRRVFDENGVLRADSDVACIRFLRQLYYAAKKVKVACDDSRTWEHVHEFFETDQGVRLPSLNWDEDELTIADLRNHHFGDPVGGSDAPLLDICNSCDTECEGPHAIPGYGALDAVQRTADIVAATLGRFDPLEWRAKHGPGAVADQRHTQFKYDFPTWPAKLSGVFPMDVFGFANYAHWADFSSSEMSRTLFSEHEPPSRLIAVPKTLKGPRLIASEPVSHQWCQQLVKDFLTRSLRGTPISSTIHFRDQSENQAFAKMASHTQSHVTIDLSSASDRLSCWVVERAFRANSSLLLALHATRTRWVVNTIDRKSPQFHKLRKFACMGSACTFPVQSYVFSILGCAALLYSRGVTPTISSIRKVAQEVRVFGDDIIIPKDGWTVLQGLLGHLGLKVNPQKTYDSGNFRESCGLDAYDGHDVTPTYSMTYPDVSRPESIMSCVATFNNFAMQGLLGTARYIKSRVARIKRLRLLHVPIGSGTFGWFDIDGEGNGHLNKRWNDHLHRVEYRADQPIGRSTRFLPKSDSVLLQYFTVTQSLAPITLGDRLGVTSRVATSLRSRWVPSA